MRILSNAIHAAKLLLQKVNSYSLNIKTKYRACIIAQAAFVWFFSAVDFQMCSQMGCSIGCIDTLMHLLGFSQLCVFKCTQCDYASFNASALRTHLKTNSEEKSNKCNQCDYASVHASIWGHIWKCTAEKCNQCDHVSTQAGNLRRHMKTCMWLCPLACIF